jgi:hypothetical protein
MNEFIESMRVDLKSALSKTLLLIEQKYEEFFRMMQNLCLIDNSEVFHNFENLLSQVPNSKILIILRILSVPLMKIEVYIVEF